MSMTSSCEVGLKSACTGRMTLCDGVGWDQEGAQRTANRWILTLADVTGPWWEPYAVQGSNSQYLQTLGMVSGGRPQGTDKKGRALSGDKSPWLQRFPASAIRRWARAGAGQLPCMCCALLMLSPALWSAVLSKAPPPLTPVRWCQRCR